MLREHDYIFSRLNMTLDFALAAGSVYLGHLFRNEIAAPYLAPRIFLFPSHWMEYWWLALLLPAVTVLLLHMLHLYRSQRVRALRSVFLRVAGCTITASLVAIVLLYLRFAGQPSLRGEDFISRGVLLFYPFFATLLLFNKVVVTRWMLTNWRVRALNTRKMIIVGSYSEAERFYASLLNHPYWGYHVGGVLSHDSVVCAAPHLPVLGEPDKLFDILDKQVIDDVVFLPATESLNDIVPLITGCEIMGIRTRLPLQIFDNSIAKPRLDLFDNLPVITFNPVKEFGVALLLKYIFDRVAAAALLLVLFPVFLVIALLGKFFNRKVGGSTFYGQQRCGLRGRQFTLWKFRTMRPHSELELAELRDQNEMTGPVFKMRNDPRVTPFGRFLRRTSLDELPQLWNVLRGEMSLVGPRPPLPSEVAQYDRWQRRRLSMKPGLTCIWQVSGRNTVSFGTWMQQDLEYIDNWSWWLDIKILLKTIYVVATGYGAM